MVNKIIHNLNIKCIQSYLQALVDIVCFFVFSIFEYCHGGFDLNFCKTFGKTYKTIDPKPEIIHSKKPTMKRIEWGQKIK